MGTNHTIKRLGVTALLAGGLSVAVIGLGGYAASAAQSQDDVAAQQTLDAIVRGDFTAATAHFDSTMQQQLPPQRLGSAWATYQEAFGSYQSHGDAQDVPLGGLTVVNMPLQMQNQPGLFRMTFHNDGTVAGLYFLKPSA